MKARKQFTKKAIVRAPVSAKDMKMLKKILGKEMNGVKKK